MKKIKYLIAFICLGCSTEITLDLPQPRQGVVVNGYIENGSFARVSLMKNSGYFEPVSLSEFGKYLINNALVVVECEGEYDTLVQENSAEYFTAYNYSGQKIKGQSLKNYKLHVFIDNVHYQSSTSIPYAYPLDTVWLELDEKDPLNTTLYEIKYTYTDPDTMGNSARFFSKSSKEIMYSSDYFSAFDDKLSNGETINFTVRRGKEPRIFGFNNNFYFFKGDTVFLKYCTIDKSSFNYWNTLEALNYAKANPVAPPIIVPTNIVSNSTQNVTGIWCGYGVTVTQLVVP